MSRLLTVFLATSLMFWPVLSQAQFLLTEETEATSYNVDIILEAATYTPNFYQGRPEPTAGNPVKVVAVPHNQPTGQADLNYNWRVGGTYFNSGTGRQSISFIPTTFESILVEVIITDQAGQLIGEGAEIFKLSDLELNFYENNPLRGLSRVAIGDNFSLIGEEMSVRAEPYFINNNAGPPNLVTEWKVNKKTVQQTDDWRDVTINSELLRNNRNTVVFSYYDLKNLSQRADGGFIISDGI